MPPRTNPASQQYRHLLSCAVLLSVHAAALDCSEHGVSYAEDTALGLPPACECTQCYGGPTCSELQPNCTVDVTTVELTIARDWFTHRSASVDLGAAYHMDYLDQWGWLHAPTPDRVTLALSDAIRKLHAAVGHLPSSVVEGYQLVVGAGAIQILSAAVYALADRPACTVFPTSTPYWGEFAEIATMQKFVWSRAVPPAEPSACTVEVLCSPNNPDGSLNRPSGRTTAVIHDLVYNWPSTSGANLSTAPDLVVFSLAKLAGYSASRVGWAFVRDPKVAEAMSTFIFLNGQGAGVEAKYRATRVLRAISASLASPTDNFFAFVDGALRTRWAALAAALAGQSGYAIDGAPDGQLFAWLRCPSTGVACAAHFAAHGVRVSAGEEFGMGAGDRHVRFIMGMASSTFELMVRRLGRAVHASASAAEATAIEEGANGDRGLV